MNQIKFIINILFIALCTLPVISQRVNYTKIETAAIHCPEFFIPEVQNLGISIEANEAALYDLLDYLNSLETAKRVKFWADADRAGSIQNLYFNYRGYNVRPNEDLQIELKIDPPVIDHKTVKKYLTSSKDGSRTDDENYSYHYKLSWYFESDIRIVNKGIVLLSKELYSSDNRFDYVVAFDENGGFYSEGELRSRYKAMEEVVFKKLERTALLAAMMEAKRVIENSLLFAYHPAEIYIGTAKSLMKDYPKLDKAESIAITAFETFSRDFNSINLLDNLEPARVAWEKILYSIDAGESNTYNNNVRAMVCNNLALCELYAYNFDAAFGLIQKANDLDKRSRQIEKTEELLSLFDLVSKSDVNLETLENRFIYLNFAVGYKDKPNATDIGEVFSRHSR